MLINQKANIQVMDTILAKGQSQSLPELPISIGVLAHFLRLFSVPILENKSFYKYNKFNK